VSSPFSGAPSRYSERLEEGETAFGGASFFEGLKKHQRSWRVMIEGAGFVLGLLRVSGSL
jgi:hypothetical protein